MYYYCSDTKCIILTKNALKRQLRQKTQARIMHPHKAATWEPKHLEDRAGAMMNGGTLQNALKSPERNEDNPGAWR